MRILSLNFIVPVIMNCPSWCEFFSFMSPLSLLDTLGRIMHFVMKDVYQKLSSLDDLRNSTKHPSAFCENFKTLKKMCSFESDQYEDNRPKSGVECTMGCRNLLRLHRALLFITNLFERVGTDPPEKSLSELAKTAYDESLSVHHPWAVRQAVSVAFRLLPNRSQFVASIVATQPKECQLTDEASCREYLFNVTLPTLRRVYKLTEDILANAKMLELP
uniref:GLTP domain-containing protein n=1 Tax=Mesocestoides corti TaxID=53468 RepID=A0A5K3F9E4_MESCO